MTNCETVCIVISSSALSLSCVSWQSRAEVYGVPVLSVLSIMTVLYAAMALVVSDGGILRFRDIVC